MKKSQRDSGLPELYVKLLREGLREIKKQQPPLPELVVLKRRIHKFLARRPGGICYKSPERLSDGGSIWLVETCPFEDEAHPHPHGYQWVKLNGKCTIEYYCRDCGGVTYWDELKQVVTI